MWGDGYVCYLNFTVLFSFCNMYTYKIIILYTLNLHAVLCKLYLNKATKKQWLQQILLSLSSDSHTSLLFKWWTDSKTFIFFFFFFSVPLSSCEIFNNPRMFSCWFHSLYYSSQLPSSCFFGQAARSLDCICAPYHVDEDCPKRSPCTELRRFFE